MANDDLISRQAAIDAARDWYERLICGSFNGLEKRLRAVPSAERRGRWIKTKDLFFNPDGSGFFYGRRCSSCTEISANATNYCPNCGARMEAE